MQCRLNAVLGNCRILKVSKSQKKILKVSFEPSNERFLFCISALASKMSQLKNIMTHYDVT